MFRTECVTRQKKFSETVTSLGSMDETQLIKQAQEGDVSAYELSRSVEGREPSEKESRWAKAVLVGLTDMRDRLQKGFVSDHAYLGELVPALLRLKYIAEGKRPPSLTIHHHRGQ